MHRVSPSRSLHPEPDDLVDQFWVRKASLFGGLGEVFVCGKDWVGIRLNEIEFIVCGQAKIEPGIAFNGEQAVNPPANLFDLPN
jgi:hypothetical protein